nr:glycosyltransferase family 4 protein [Chryseosolibacter indicus]
MRSYYLAKALVDRGVQVVVITGYNGKDYEKKQIDGIEVHYLPIAYNNGFGFYKRSYSFIRFIILSIRYGSIHKDASICYAISVPLTIGIAALELKRRYKIPFIFEVGDLWPDAPIQLGFIKNPLLKTLLYQLETKIYQRSKSVVALSTAIKNSIEKKVPGKRIDIIPNMSDTDFFKPEEKRFDLVKKFDVEGKFVVSYIGAIGFANGLDFFLECARACQKAALPVQFVMCGDGAMLKRLKEISERNELKNFSIIPFQNRDGIAEIMNITDASFVCYRPEPILETGSPNKYFDALAAGKMIIANFAGWIKEEIEKEGCGFYVPSSSPETIITKLARCIENPSVLINYQKASRSLAERKYSRKLLGDAFYNLINEQGSI